MIVGHAPIFGGRPILEAIEDTLDRDSEQYWTELTKIEAFLTTAQLAGYASWATALNIKGHYAEVFKILKLGKRRMEEQKRVIAPLMLRECSAIIYIKGTLPRKSM